MDNATVPVIETGTGICHIYVDQWADQGMALDILENAKCSRPSVCNAAEVCLVDRKIAGEFLPKLKARLVDGRAAAGQPPVELRLDETAAAVIDGAPAGERDFDTEFLDYILAVRVVDGVEGAVAHIAAHSTGHSECIVTGDEKAAHAFQRQVDSAAVYWNASTRFTDGGEFGLGCEMGISTQKLHARWAWRSCVPLSLSPGGAVRSGKHFSGFLPFPGDNGPGRGYYDVGGIGCSGDHSCKKRPLGWNGLKTLHLNRANLPCKFWISMLVSLFSTHYNRDRARPADVLLDAGSPRLVRGAVYHIPTTAV